MGLELNCVLWHGCLHSNMGAICLSILHLDDSWSHYLLEQTLHHHCQVVGACYSVSPFLQQTVILVFSFTYLQNYYGDGRSLAVWLYDGNVPFLQGKHMALFLHDGLGCHSVLHLSIQSGTVVCSLHTSLQTLPIQVCKDETLTLTGCVKLFVVYMT